VLQLFRSRAYRSTEPASASTQDATSAGRPRRQRRRRLVLGTAAVVAVAAAIVAPASPAQALTGWQQIALNGLLGDDAIACGIFIDRLWCRHNDAADFKQVTVFSDWTAVTVGAGHWCALRSAGSLSNDGALYCWGRNAEGQLGLGHTVDQNGPLPAHVGTMRWTSISTGWNDTCGISSQTLYCWGSGENGVLGLGNDANQTRPTRKRSWAPRRCTQVWTRSGGGAGR